MQQPLTPIALLFSSLAYFYNTANNVLPPQLSVPFRRAIPNPIAFLNVSTTLVETQYGVLRGTQEKSRTGKTYHSFKGIPYATPPLGNLRFEPPEPPKKWRGIRDATRWGSQCPQMNLITRRNVVGNENCLFLNVFTHKVYNRSDVRHFSLNPVIVFIHGGIFMLGGSNIYRPKYWMDEQVVLVTINYRLASFGFLNTGDGIIAGNMGLKDQVMAIRWVKENIFKFGGDNRLITVMGESAGGASAHLHTLSPLSKGLFHTAISMSGTALSPWVIIENPASQAKEYAEGLGCPTENTTTMVSCLKTLDANKIARSHFGYINALANKKQSVFGPTVESVINDNTFLPAPPIEILRSGNINNVPWMTGVNSEEGLVYLIQWEKYAGTFLNLPESEVNSNLLKDIRKYYLNDSDIDLTTIKKAADMISDRAFFLDNHDAVILQSKVAKVYPYYYKYNGRYAMGKLLFVKRPLPFRIPNRYEFDLGSVSSWFGEYVLGIREPNRFGIGHSDEIPLFFNCPFIRLEVVPEDEDYLVSRYLIHLWASFATKGVPDTRSLHLPDWHPINKDETGNRALKRYILDKKPKMGEEPFFERLQFWKMRNISYV